MTPAKVTIYPVDSRGLELSNSHPVGIDAMRDMAADTGGIAYVNTNDIKGAIHAVIDDRSATYTLGFYVDAASVDGNFHNLKIRVNTPDAKLRYARGYFATKNQAQKVVSLEYQPSKPPKLVSVTGLDLLTEAIRSPHAATGVPVDVKLERDADHAVLRLLGTVGVEGISLVQDGTTREGGIIVDTVEQNAAGDVLSRTTHQMQLTLTDQQFADYKKTGVQFSESVQPKTQTSVIRIIVRDAATARIGSMIIPLSQVR